MANEAIFAYATQVVLEANGGAVTTGAFGAANDATLTATNHLNYPLADFVLSCQLSATGGVGVVINLYRRDLAIDGANNAPTPATTYKQTYVGSFPLPDSQAANTTIYLPLNSVTLSKGCSFFIENATAVSVNAGWIMKATPKTYSPGA